MKTIIMFRNTNFPLYLIWRRLIYREQVTPANGYLLFGQTVRSFVVWTTVISFFVRETVKSGIECYEKNYFKKTPAFWCFCIVRFFAFLIFSSLKLTFGSNLTSGICSVHLSRIKFFKRILKSQPNQIHCSIIKL